MSILMPLTYADPIETSPDDDSGWETVPRKKSRKQTLADFMPHPDPIDTRSAFTKLADLCTECLPEEESNSNTSQSSTHNSTTTPQLSQRQKKRFAVKSKLKGNPSTSMRGSLPTRCPQEGQATEIARPIKRVVRCLTQTGGAATRRGSSHTRCQREDRTTKIVPSMCKCTNMCRGTNTPSGPKDPSEHLDPRDGSSW